MSKSKSRKTVGEQVELSPRRGSATVDLTRFVNKVADRFESDSHRSRRVTTVARRALVQKMKPHMFQLEADLSSGKMTTRKLAGILREVLEEASKLSTGIWGRQMRVGRNPSTGEAVSLRAVRSQVIGSNLVLVTMRSTCRYLGWC